jgi:hypothetical protein
MLEGEKDAFAMVISSRPCPTLRTSVNAIRRDIESGREIDVMGRCEWLGMLPRCSKA